MPTVKKAKIPKYCLLQPRGLVYVRIRGRARYPDKYGTPESREAYGRLVAELATQPDLSRAAATGALCLNIRDWVFAKVSAS